MRWHSNEFETNPSILKPQSGVHCFKNVDKTIAGNEPNHKISLQSTKNLPRWQSGISWFYYPDKKTPHTKYVLLFYPFECQEDIYGTAKIYGVT